MTEIKCIMRTGVQDLTYLGCEGKARNISDISSALLSFYTTKVQSFAVFIQGWCYLQYHYRKVTKIQEKFCTYYTEITKLVISTYILSLLLFFFPKIQNRNSICKWFFLVCCGHLSTLVMSIFITWVSKSSLIPDCQIAVAFSFLQLLTIIVCTCL